MSLFSLTLHVWLAEWPSIDCRLHIPLDANTIKWDAWGSIEILKETTKAIMFLHENRILHGDLKAAK